MVEAAWIEAEVLKAVPEAHVEVIDLHGSGDHFHVRVISETFEGVRPLQRQKQVLAVMGQHIPHPCLLYTSPSPRDRQKSRMPSSA